MSILTLTLNPSIDHILLTEQIQWNNKNILNSSQVFMGGKGINVAYTLGKLGAPAIACGLIGEDAIKALTRKMEQQGVIVRFAIADDTRHSFKIMDRKNGKDTEFNQRGIPVSSEQIRQLLTIVENSLDGAQWLILSGSLSPGIPHGIYTDLIEQCHQKGIFSVLDTSGEPLKSGLEAKPTMLRINRSELEEIFPGRDHTPAAIKTSFEAIHRRGILYCVVSYGSEGAIGSNGELIWKIGVPSLKPISLTGAGDAMTAGLVASLAKGKTFKESLRFSSALATASTQQLEPGDFFHKDLEYVLQATTIEHLI